MSETKTTQILGRLKALVPQIKNKNKNKYHMSNEYVWLELNDMVMTSFRCENYMIDYACTGTSVTDVRLRFVMSIIVMVDNCIHKRSVPING